jgi:hypothetical protein
MSEVNDVKDLGSGVIHGVECDHLAFRTKEVDWQIWIGQGARPYPCRYVITSKKVTGWPLPSARHRPDGVTVPIFLIDTAADPKIEGDVVFIVTATEPTTFDIQIV